MTKAPEPAHINTLININKHPHIRKINNKGHEKNIRPEIIDFSISLTATTASF